MEVELIVIVIAILLAIAAIVVAAIAMKKESAAAPASDISMSDSQMTGAVPIARMTPAMVALKRTIDSYVPLPNGMDKWGNPVLLVDEVLMKICVQLAVQAAAKGNFGIGVAIYDTKGDMANMIQGTFLQDDPQVGPGKVFYTDYLKRVLYMLDPSYLNANHPHRAILDRIVGLGHNQLFTQGILTPSTPHVRSDRHGEMVTMDLLENAIASIPAKEARFQTKFPEGVVLYTQLESCGMCMSRLISSSIGTVLHGAADLGGGFVHKSCGYPPVFINLMSLQKYDTAKISRDKKNPHSNEHLVGMCSNAFLVNIGDVGTKQNHRACRKNADGTATCPDFKYCYPVREKSIIGRSAYDLEDYAQ